MNSRRLSMQFKLPNVSLGASLIELMISLTIGLIIIAGIGYAYLGSRQSFRTQDALSRMQEGARTAFELMDRDIRMAGFRGCPVSLIAAPGGDINILTASADWDKNLLLQPLIGYEKTGGAWSAFPAGVTGVVGNVLQGDALTVLHADNTQEFIVSSHDTANNQLTLTTNHNIQKGEILIAAKDDCSRVAVFQKTDACSNAAAIVDNSVAGSCGNKLVQHGKDNTTATYALGAPAGTVDTFGLGSRIYRLSANTYYIGTSPTTLEPALMRQTLGTNGTNPNNTQQELIEGVQDMQLSYGIDTNNDNAVDSYVVAGNVPDWSRVLGIRVSLLMVSRSSEAGITTKAQQYTLDMNGNGTIDAGETFTPTDKLYRKVFTTTIAVENRT